MLDDVHAAVQAAFADPTLWRETLDRHDYDALTLIIDQHHFLEEMAAAAGDDFKTPGTGILTLVNSLHLDELFFFHCRSEERHNCGAKLNLWDHHRQTLAMTRTGNIFRDWPRNQQLREIRRFAQETYPMPGYQAQLLHCASEVTDWPGNAGLIAEICQRYEDGCGDDTEFVAVIAAWRALVDVLLPAPAAEIAA